jgi:hypothetical protein
MEKPCRCAAFLCAGVTQNREPAGPNGKARSESTALLVLAGLSIVYLALAGAQWRRVEA